MLVRVDSAMMHTDYMSYMNMCMDSVTIMIMFWGGVFRTLTPVAVAAVHPKILNPENNHLYMDFR